MPTPAATSVPTSAPITTAPPATTPAPTTTPSPTAAPTPAATPAATPAPSFPLAVVVHNTDLRATTTSAALIAAVAKGSLIVPCGVGSLTIGGTPVTTPPTCTPDLEIAAKLAQQPKSIALLPAGLVDPRVKVLVVDGADLFGNTVVRAKPYPVIGTEGDGAHDIAGAATAYDVNEIRTIVSTGDTCPDRSVSLWANTLRKGWDWTLKGGTAKYRGTFIHPGFGWRAVSAVRTGKGAGVIWNMIRDADLAVNDFECPMVAEFTQHNTGTFFTIDPKVADLFTRVGMDFASLGSNHGTDLGANGIRQTLALLDKAGVKYSGMGLTLAQAMAPAVFDVRGLRIAFLSWDATGTSRAATKTGWGELHPYASYVRQAVALAKAQSDMVILMPQWNWPEYSAPFSKAALQQRDAWFAAGVDHILGSGTHWAGAMSVTQPDPAKGWRLAVTSHGNFLFGQGWSRQTQEGLIYEVTFRGTALVQVRVHPYIVMDGAQPSLVAPTTDGAYVQNQAFGVSTLP
jgi:poly-gamma-glutamate synthesis protein (capsule biosynthesis protein)